MERNAFNQNQLFGRFTNSFCIVSALYSEPTNMMVLVVNGKVAVLECSDSEKTATQSLF